MQGKETHNRNQISQWGCYTPSLSGWFQLLQTFHIFPVCFLGRGWAEAGLHIRDLKGSHFQTVEFLLADQFGGEKTGSCWLSAGGELGFCGKFSGKNRWLKVLKISLSCVLQWPHGIVMFPRDYKQTPNWNENLAGISATSEYWPVLHATCKCCFHLGRE